MLARNQGYQVGKGLSLCPVILPRLFVEPGMPSSQMGCFELQQKEPIGLTAGN
jgi:hypothetical protein